jgi:deazaflavin-dependent oxidoreductase (nitroreductase family)
MTAIREQTAKTPPRFLIRTFWLLHRAAYRVSRGRFGLSQPEAGGRFGTMRLATVGRRSGKPRLAIVGYYEDGPNLVTLAMNGWGEGEPAWWLNLQAKPDTVVGLADGPRAVRARAASGAERERLWARFGEFPGWGDDIDGLAARRPRETTVVVFEPRADEGVDRGETSGEGDPGREGREDAMPPSALATRHDVDRRRRLRLRHLLIVPGLAIAFFANGQAAQLGVGIGALLAFGIAPDLPRLLGLGQPHAHGQMAARAVPAFNVMHHPVPPFVLIALGAAGVVPAVLYVGALTWLGHIVIGLGIGDRLRTGDGYLRPLWAVGRPAGRSAATTATGASTSAQRAA